MAIRRACESETDPIPNGFLTHKETIKQKRNEGYGPGVNLVGNQGGERSANPVTIGRKAQAEAFEK